MQSFLSTFVKLTKYHNFVLDKKKCLRHLWNYNNIFDRELLSAGIVSPAHKQCIT